MKFTYYADLRYAGQEHYVKVLLENFTSNTPLETIISHFHKEHKKHYSFDLEAPVELVNFHLVAEVEVEKPDFPTFKKTGKRVEDAIFDKRKVDFDDLGIHQTSFYNRQLLEPDMVIQGPAIIAERDTTTVVSPVHKLSVDIYGNLILKLQKTQ
jgi:N-methylhydantoinase A